MWKKQIISLSICLIFITACSNQNSLSDRPTSELVHQWGKGGERTLDIGLPQIGDYSIVQETIQQQVQAQALEATRIASLEPSPYNGHVNPNFDFTEFGIGNSWWVFSHQEGFDGISDTDRGLASMGVFFTDATSWRAGDGCNELGGYYHKNSLGTFDKPIVTRTLVGCMWRVKDENGNEILVAYEKLAGSQLLKHVWENLDWAELRGEQLYIPLAFQSKHGYVVLEPYTTLAPYRELAGSSWELTLAGAQAFFSEIDFDYIDLTKVTITFTDAQSWYGFDGCNEWSVSAEGLNSTDRECFVEIPNSTGQTDMIEVHTLLQHLLIEGAFRNVPLARKDGETLSVPTPYRNNLRYLKFTQKE